MLWSLWNWVADNQIYQVIRVTWQNFLMHHHYQVEPNYVEAGCMYSFYATPVYLGPNPRTSYTSIHCKTYIILLGADAGLERTFHSLSLNSKFWNYFCSSVAYDKQVTAAISFHHYMVEVHYFLLCMRSGFYFKIPSLHYKNLPAETPCTDPFHLNIRWKMIDQGNTFYIPSLYETYGADTVFLKFVCSDLEVDFGSKESASMVHTALLIKR